jgi:apolipoprotein N-acyltransferase
MAASPRTGWILVVISAVLQTLIFPSPSLYFLSWIALAPWLVAVLDRRCAPSLLRCVLLSYVCGVLWYAGSCFWIFHVMNTYGGLSAPMAVVILLLFCFYVGLYHALFGFVLGWLSRRRTFANARALALSPVLWVAVEYARSHITSFPWDLLGYAAIDNIPLTRLATVTGVYGLSFVIALVNTAFALAFLLPRQRRVGVALPVLLAAIALQSGALVRYSPIQATHTAVLVQENLSLANRQWTSAEFNQTLANLVELSDQGVAKRAGDKAAPLILWPESPAQFFTSDPGFRSWMSALARTTHGYVIAGSLGTAPTADSAHSHIFNSAQLVLPDGGFGPRYDKIHLVPFGEFVPYRDLLFFAQSLTHDVGELSRGNRRIVFDMMEGHHAGTFICYESAFPEEVRQFALNGADLFVNLSDDGWYGRYGAPPQHLNIARMRAIENGRWLLRATNTGVTASISPLGEVVAAAPIDVRTVLDAPYDFESGTTFYTRHGDWFASACAIISVLALLASVLSGTPAGSH